MVRILLPFCRCRRCTSDTFGSSQKVRIDGTKESAYARSVTTWHLDFRKSLSGNPMLTDQQIQDLVVHPKAITRKDPSKGYRQENRQRRCDLELESTLDGNITFPVFVRQNTEFIENFSIGLRYRIAASQTLGTITLVRYNGPHGETSRHSDGHFAKSHVHRITESEIESGSTQPQESDREITYRYNTFEQALVVFFNDIHVTNSEDYFPRLLKGSLFNERS